MWILKYLLMETEFESIIFIRLSCKQTQVRSPIDISLHIYHLFPSVSSHSNWLVQTLWIVFSFGVCSFQTYSATCLSFDHVLVLFSPFVYITASLQKLNYFEGLLEWLGVLVECISLKLLTFFASISLMLQIRFSFWLLFFLGVMTSLPPPCHVSL